LPNRRIGGQNTSMHHFGVVGVIETASPCFVISKRKLQADHVAAKLYRQRGHRVGHADARDGGAVE